MYDRSFIDLLVWIKQFNLAHPRDMVILKGVDITGASASFANYFMYNFSSLLDSATKKNVDNIWYKTPLDSIAKQLITWFYKNKDTVQAKLKQNYADFLYTVENAQNSIIHATEKKENFYHAAFFRDSTMASNIKKLCIVKSIFWAHNAHMTPAANYAAGPILKKWFNDQYYMVVSDFSQKASVLVRKDTGMTEKKFTPDKLTLGYQLSQKMNIYQGIIFYSDIPKTDKKLHPWFGSIDNVGTYQILGIENGFDALIMLKEIIPSVH